MAGCARRYIGEWFVKAGFDLVHFALNSGFVTIHDMRGEVDVSVSPRNREWPQRWSYAGMVGRASVGRLLELALVDMIAEPAILAGDPDFYERLGMGNAASSHAWTEYYAGRGPRPGDKHLP